jgi:hypothetical protein
MKSVIDMSRANTLYLAGLGVLMLLSLLINNLPQIAPSTYYHIYFQKEMTAGLLAGGGLFGLLAVQRHTARAKEAWRVPQSQVSICFAMFFALTMAGILISR